MIGRGNCHHLAVGTRPHAGRIYARLLRQGLMRAAGRAKVASMPDYELDRQRIVDVIEGSDYLTIVAELFGVHAEDLKMDLEGDALKIAAGHLRKDVVLPRPAETIIMKSFKNGILVLNLD
jgi:HSP20 family molecular chaperone IbpA